MLALQGHGGHHLSSRHPSRPSGPSDDHPDHAVHPTGDETGGQPHPLLPLLALWVPDTEQDGARKWPWPPTAPHRAAATCWEGQGGRAPAQHGPKACLAWGAPEFSRGVEAAICGEGDGKMGGHRDPRPAPGSLGEPPYLPCRRGWGRSCWASWRMGRSWGPCRSRPLSWGGTPAGAVGMVKQEGLGLNSVSPPPYPPVHCTAPTPLSKTVVASVCGLLVSSPICSSFFTPPPAHSAESQIQT